MTGSFTDPRALADLLHYRIATLESHCGAIVTRLCEGEFGVTRREWRFLGLLAQHGSLRPSELALLASLDRGSASKTLASLVEKGLARRSAVRGDARSANVELTPSGHALYEEIFSALAAMNAAILRDFEPERLAELAAMLDRLETRAQELMRSLAPGARADRRLGGSRNTWRQREVESTAAQEMPTIVAGPTSGRS